MLILRPSRRYRTFHSGARAAAAGTTYTQSLTGTLALFAAAASTGSVAALADTTVAVFHLVLIAGASSADAEPESGFILLVTPDGFQEFTVGG